MTSKVVCILNPQANGGRAQAWLPRLQEAVAGLDSIEVDWRLTEGPGHAVELARAAAEAGATRVVALGGDGTVNEVVNGLMQVPEAQRPVLGVVPVGAGNDFAYAAGFSKHPIQALHQSLTAAPRPVDVAWVRDDRDRERYWDNTLGIGFDAVVNLRSRRLKRIRGLWRYVVALFQTVWWDYRSVPMRLAWDFGTEERDILMLVLCNGPREGGTFLVAPEARPDDGLLHYASIPFVSRPTLLYLIPLVILGKHGRHPKVRLGHFRSLVIEAHGPMYIHIDGETFADFAHPAYRLEVRVHPAALRVAAPPC